MQIRAEVDESSPGSGNAGGSLVFSTTGQGGTTLVDRLVISQGGAASFQGPITGASTATFAGLVTASLGLSVPSGALSAGGNLAVAGAIAGSSTASFAGLVTAGGGLAVTGSITGSSTAAFGGLVTAASGLTIASGALTAAGAGNFAGTTLPTCHARAAPAFESQRFGIIYHKQQRICGRRSKLQVLTWANCWCWLQAP